MSDDNKPPASPIPPAPNLSSANLEAVALEKASPYQLFFATLTRIVFVLCALYIFLLSVTLIGGSFNALGKGFADSLFKHTQNPLVGLFIGILATSLVQSSSCTTSIVVGMVMSGQLNVSNAVPIIMGANIGTTVTNTLVSLGHVTRKNEFQRAMAGSLVHDFFNLLVVVILLPIEVIWHPLEKSAVALSGMLVNVDAEAATFKSPLKKILAPAKDFFINLTKTADGEHSTLGIMLLLAFALGLLFFSLWALTKVMRKVLSGRFENVIDKALGSSPFVGMLVGCVLTVVVQSSSAVTSILVPLAGAGILTTQQIFPITLGSNVGTTITAILAALSGGASAGLTIALVHMLFNISGIVLVYPIPKIRAIPIRMAEKMAALTAESKRYAIFYVVGVFFLLPAVIFGITELF